MGGFGIDWYIIFTCQDIMFTRESSVVFPWCLYNKTNYFVTGLTGSIEGLGETKLTVSLGASHCQCLLISLGILKNGVLIVVWFVLPA